MITITIKTRLSLTVSTTPAPHYVHPRACTCHPPGCMASKALASHALVHVCAGLQQQADDGGVPRVHRHDERCDAVTRARRALQRVLQASAWTPARRAQPTRHTL